MKKRTKPSWTGRIYKTKSETFVWVIESKGISIVVESTKEFKTLSGAIKNIEKIGEMCGLTINLNKIRIVS